MNASKPAVPDDDDDTPGIDMTLLTDEERAALVEDEPEEGDEEQEDGQGDADTEDAAGEAPAAVDAPAEPAAPEAQQPERLPDLDPLNARLDAIAAERDKLMERFEDGDLPRSEYKAQVDALAAEERKLAATVAKVEARREAIATAWYGEVKAYAQRYPELLDPQGAHVEAFDRHVRAVTSNAAYEHLTYPEMLEAAHALYEAEAKVLKRPHVPRNADLLKPAPKAEAPKPAAKRPEIPPSIAKAPAAAAVAVADGKFAALQQQIDRATTAAEREAIMRSLSPEEAEAFASMDV